jgi:hypothetical protein
VISLLSIGISDYSVANQFDPSFDDLDYGASDAKRFAQVAATTLSVGRSTTLISGAAPMNRATRLNIIRSVIETAKAGKTAMVYFAGHGLDINGSLHLCPEDYDPRVPEHASVSASFLVSTLAANTDWSLIVLDACRSADLQSGSAQSSRGRTGVVYVADNVCILMGCSNGEQSLEVASIEGEPAGGVFTHFLCQELLRTPASRRRIDSAALFHTAQERVSLFASEIDDKQTPRAVGMSLNDFMLPGRRGRKAEDPLPIHPLLMDPADQIMPAKMFRLEAAPASFELEAQSASLRLDAAILRDASF